MFGDIDFWKKYKDIGLLWDQIKRHTELNKYLSEDEIKKFTMQFEFIK